MSMPENHDDTTPFHLMVGGDVTPLAKGGHHVSRRSSAPLEIRLRRDADDFLGHHEKGRPVHPSAKQVDNRTGKRLRQGKMTIDGRLDLHGYREDEARIVLRRFVARAVEDGKRCLLVVTGKGDVGAGDHEAPARGVIRRALPGWLTQAPLDHWVLACERAKEKDGGAGAVYLYLRRPR